MTDVKSMVDRYVIQADEMAMIRVRGFEVGLFGICNLGFSLCIDGNRSGVRFFLLEAVPITASYDYESQVVTQTRIVGGVSGLYTSPVLSDIPVKVRSPWRLW